MKDLAASPHAAGIIRLRVEHGRITGRDAAHLLRLPSLRLLELPHCAITLEDFEPFLARPELSGLIRLDLSGNALGKNGLACIARRGHLAGLRELDLSGCGITDASIPSLTGDTSLTGLRRLRLSGLQKHASAVALAGAPALADLVELDLRGCHFGGRSRALLRERFGDALVM
jgi:hypothetical protein